MLAVPLIAMDFEDGECSSSTNGAGSHKDEFLNKEILESSDSEEDHSLTLDEQRCDTELRESPDTDQNPSADVEGLLEITASNLKIGKRIGKGGQATIYVARYCDSTDVVVKKFKKGFCGQGQWPRELFKTAQFNVCQLIGYVENPKKNGISLVMQKYSGDLRKVIDKVHPFKFPVTLDIITQIAMGMKLLHDQDIVHKDLKAENIFVQKSKDNIPYGVYIGDFENALMVAGTAFWRPPEVLEALKVRRYPLPFTFAGDVYSFGMVCYEILTGNIPFQGHEIRDYDLILAGNRPELPADLDVDLKKIILKCWNADPNARPSFTDICLELRQQAEAVEDVATRSVVMGKFEVFDEFCRGPSTSQVKVLELKQMLHSLAQEYGSEAEFVWRGFQLVACIEQFMFQFGSLSSSFIDTPVLPFSSWLERMWLCNAVLFKRHKFLALLPYVGLTYNVVKVVWELTAKISEGCENSTWGEDDSMTEEEKISALKAFTEEQKRQIKQQRQQGFDLHRVCVRPLSKLQCLVQKATQYTRGFLGMQSTPAHHCDYCS